MNKSLVFLVMLLWYLLPANTTFANKWADTMRGTNGRGRDWWDVQKYVLKVEFDTASEVIRGSVFIDLKVLGKARDSMQIDLQEPMVIDRIYEVNGFDFRTLGYFKQGEVYWVNDWRYPLGNWSDIGNHSIMIYFHGRPKDAVNAPWDGGFTRKKDSLGHAWTAVSCQGLGASVWWPCKDAQWDEPDRGMDIHLLVKGDCQAISNGRLVDITDKDSARDFHWKVENPINNYDVTFYIGDYVHWHDTLAGEKGKLDLDFWSLRYHQPQAMEHFKEVKPMLRCFEYWMGPYPFYEDGYKLVEAPYLGMEHQSAIAYGNKFMNGYRGFDRTMTGVGNHFDYIIVHESAHEWFGNSITAKDMADNWIHEGFAAYAEALYAECLLGKEQGLKYAHGEWNGIYNSKPVIGEYGINKEGGDDMYDKGAAVLSMIRVMTGGDEKFRQMLRGLSKAFYHKTVTTRQVEDYISENTGLELKAFFNQYLRTTKIPKLEYNIKDGKLNYRFTNITDGFTLPLTLTAGDTKTTIRPTAEWQQINWNGGYNVEFSKDFLIKVKL